MIYKRGGQALRLVKKFFLLILMTSPHYGCLFADYLLDKIPKRVRNFVADKYNRTLRKLGDSDPDFWMLYL